MSQALQSQSDDAAGLPSAPRMDRVMAWLAEPAQRLARMLQDTHGFAAVRHVSLSVYEAATDMLWAFSCTPEGGGPIEIDEIEISDAPSLALMMGSTEPRIVSDLAEFAEVSRYHTNGARASGCRSSMTVPIHHDDDFRGFAIFGATRPGFFDPATRDVLETFAEAFAILISRAMDEAAA